MNQPFRKILKISLYLLLSGGAALLLGWTAALLAVRYNLTKVAGKIDRDSAAYQSIVSSETSSQPAITTESLLPMAGPSQLAAAIEKLNLDTVCRLKIVSQAGYAAPKQSWQVWSRQPELGERWLAAAALSQWLTYRRGREAASDTALQACQVSQLANQVIIDQIDQTASGQLFAWQGGEEWPVIEAALRKDQATINKAAQLAGIKPRMLVSAAIVEQLRLYYTQRELFEKFFKPLNILATANKMAWGVMAIKEKTAIATEDHLIDSKSPFYLGAERADLLALPADKRAQVRYQRLTDEHDHYYSYLYGGLYLAQVTKQWQVAGYDISQRPEILVTLYNIGFNRSIPKADPQVGGSTIKIASRDYSFGGLGFEFYYSNALTDIFPY